MAPTLRAGIGRLGSRQNHYELDLSGNGTGPFADAVTLVDAAGNPVAIGAGGGGTAGGLTETELRSAPIDVTVTDPVSVFGPLTDVQLRAAPLSVAQSGAWTMGVSGTVAVSGPLTDAQLRATAVPISGTVAVSGTIPVSGPLTDAQLRATPVPISGAVTQSGAWSMSVSGTVPVSGPLTDTQLRASAVPVTVSADIQQKPSKLGVTAVGAAAAAVTLTLPAVAGLFHNISLIEIELYSTAARTGVAAPITVTTTNLPGSPAFLFSTAAAIGTSCRNAVYGPERSYNDRLSRRYRRHLAR
jgi:hypothetical protein